MGPHRSALMTVGISTGSVSVPTTGARLIGKPADGTLSLPRRLGRCVVKRSAARPSIFELTVSLVSTRAAHRASLRQDYKLPAPQLCQLRLLMVRIILRSHRWHCAAE